MDEKFLRAFRRMQERIRQSPTSSGGEVIFHKDGSVTENRWQARICDESVPR